MELEETLELKNKYGLHARASTTLVAVTMKFRSQIHISRSEDSQEVDGKSILGILTLGVEKGMSIRVRVRGDDADEALRAIRALVEANFHED